ncbi:MAG: hypothetical protein ACR2PJ_07280, partial [Pseudomonadales bacterium]
MGASAGTKPRRCIGCLLLLAALLALPPVYGADDQAQSAQATQQKAQQEEQRQQYQHALHLLGTRQYTRYFKLKPKLRDYSLFPYLEYKEYLARLSRQKESDLLAFAERHKDTPLVQPLLQRWLENLAKRREWDAFTKHYHLAPATKLMACRYGYALHKLGRNDDMMQQAHKLWLVDYSQPDECDPVFKLWREADGLTQELAWRRFSLAIWADQRQLARYLVRFLEASVQPYAHSFLKVQRSPQRIKRSRSYSAKNKYNREIILYGIERLARSDPEAALKALNSYRA